MCNNKAMTINFQMQFVCNDTFRWTLANILEALLDYMFYQVVTKKATILNANYFGYVIYKKKINEKVTF